MNSRFFNIFSLLLASACFITQSEAADSCGEPAWDPAVDHGLVLWQDCTTGIWQARVSTNTQTKNLVFNGSITTNQGFDSITPLNIESSDTFNTSDPLALSLQLKAANPWWDGFSFSYSGYACLEIIPNAKVSNTVLIGPNKTPLTTPLDLNTLGPCAGPEPTLSIADVMVSEADVEASFTVTLSAASTDT
ncbi:MAG: hypothetical protein V3V12_06595, partial [Gammaproteobacteria bacterium]